MKRTIQFLTVMFALCMLGAYVVYSQRQQSRTVAPGSKFMAPPESTSQTGLSYTVIGSNSPATHSDAVMPGSKNGSVITPPPGMTQSEWIASMTSKSGRIFESVDSGITQAVSRKVGSTNVSGGRPTNRTVKPISTAGSTEASARKLAATNAQPAKASP